MIEVRKAGPGSIPVIQEIAGKTWPVAYSSIISKAQLQYMLDLFYSSSSLFNQMQQGHLFILALEDEKATGFASYSPSPSSTLYAKSDLAEKNIYRLHKLYVIPGHQGSGTGKILLSNIIDQTRASGATNLELNVNRNNRAMGFYLKHGFVVAKEEDIDIGNGFYMNDYVMDLDLTP